MGGVSVIIGEYKIYYKYILSFVAYILSILCFIIVSINNFYIRYVKKKNIKLYLSESLDLKMVINSFYGCFYTDITCKKRGPFDNLQRRVCDAFSLKR